MKIRRCPTMDSAGRPSSGQTSHHQREAPGSCSLAFGPFRLAALPFPGEVHGKGSKATYRIGRGCAQRGRSRREIVGRGDVNASTRTSYRGTIPASFPRRAGLVLGPLWGPFGCAESALYARGRRRFPSPAWCCRTGGRVPFIAHQKGRAGASPRDARFQITWWWPSCSRSADPATDRRSPLTVERG